MRIKSDEIDLKKAAELNNTAGKLLKYQQLKLAASIARNEQPDNSFYVGAPTKVAGPAVKSIASGTVQREGNSTKHTMA